MQDLLEIIKNFPQLSWGVTILVIVAVTIVIIFSLAKANKFTLFTFGKVLFGHFEREDSSYDNKVNEMQRKLDLQTISDMFFGEYVSKLSNLTDSIETLNSKELEFEKKTLANLILDYVIKFILIDEKQKKRGFLMEVKPNNTISIISQIGYTNLAINKIEETASTKKSFFHSVILASEDIVSEDIRKEIAYDDIFQEEDDIYPSILINCIKNGQGKPISYLVIQSEKPVNYKSIKLKLMQIKQMILLLISLISTNKKSGIKSTKVEDINKGFKFIKVDYKNGEEKE